MPSSPPLRRFPPPWRVERASEDAYVVRDANGVAVAWVYCRDDLHKYQWHNYWERLTSDEARQIASAVARIPELLRPGIDFSK